MKRISFAIAAIGSLLMTSAFAADLAPRMYAKAPLPAVVVYDWTGFYIGGNIGYSWGRSSDTSSLTNPAGTVLFASLGSSNLNGVLGGGQIGYNWQTQNWVWGLEADIQGTDEKGGRGFTFVTAPIIGNNFAPSFAIPFALNQKIDWFGTVRGRVGVLVSPKVLLYATGGLAYGGVNTSETIGVVTPVGFANTDTRVGYTAGAGIEGVIGGNWTAKLEYLWVDLGTTSGSFVTPLGAPGGGFITSNYSSHITDNVLRVGVNYKFGGPVVAKY
jgi:outer membrane immunogenic protein